MSHRSSWWIFCASVLWLAAASSAHAGATKLDPLVRMAIESRKAGMAAESRHAGGFVLSPAGELDVFIRGTASRAALEAAGARVRTTLPGVTTAYVPFDAIERIAALADVTQICGASMCEPDLNVSVPAVGADVLRGAGPDFTGLNGAGVLVGIVDSGVDYHHEDFKHPDLTTRFVSIWDQTDGGGPGAIGFGYGSEWTPADINAEIAREEDQISHGSHILGIAAGDGSMTNGAIPAYTFAGFAPKASLVGVKTTFSNAAVVDGVAYIFARATALGMNAVANLSLSNQFGPRDGTSAFESAFTALSGPGRIITKSAGNERGVARHAEVFVPGEGSAIATIAVAGANGGSSFALDGYYESTENVNVSITTPDGTVIGPIARGALNAPYPGTATTNGLVYLENGVATTSGGDYEVVVGVLADGASMNGTWTFTFTPVTIGPANGEVDLWRYSGIGGFVIGNTNDELLGEPGNAHGVLAFAAWATKQFWTDCSGTSGTTFPGTVPVGNLAPFSSPGPTRDGRPKPEVTAPGAVIASVSSTDRNPFCPGPGSRMLPDGNYHLMDHGTSMSCGHGTGVAALLLQKYGAVTPAFIASYLTSHAIADGFTGAVPNKDWGAGKMRLGDLIDPIVTVASPNGGESWTEGSSHDILWIASDNIAVTTVDLAYSTDGGATWPHVIATGEANDGSYAWTVPGTTGTTVRVRVTAHDAENNSGADASNGDFTITPAGGPPPAIADLVATPVRSGNDADGTAKILLSWSATAPGTTVEVYRAPSGGYPAYGGTIDPGPAAPASYPPDAPWVLASVSAPATPDEPATREFWYYVAFVKEGPHVSAVSNRTGGTLNYRLADVADGVTPGQGDNLVDTADLALLGFHYGASGPALGSVPFLDYGPTSDFTTDSRPLTDGQADFEELVLLALDYESVSGPFARRTPVATTSGDEVRVSPPATVLGGQPFEAVLRWSGSGAVHAASIQLEWDTAVAAMRGVTAGALLAGQDGIVLSPGSGVVDLAVLGANRPGLIGTGDAVVVQFDALQAGAPAVRVASVAARDANNQPIALTVDVETGPLPPVRTSLALASSNPARGSVALRMELSESGPAELEIFGVDGRRVRALVREPREPGSYRVTWDGRDEGGSAVAPGVYVARLTTRSGHWSRTLAWLR